MYDVMFCGPDNLERELIVDRVRAALPQGSYFIAGSFHETLRAVSLEGVRVLVSLVADFDYQNLSFLRWVSEVSPATRFVVVSSAPLYSVAGSVSTLGVSKYFVRPVRPDCLVHCVCKLVGSVDAGTGQLARETSRDDEAFEERLVAVRKHLAEQLHACRFSECLGVVSSFLGFTWEHAKNPARIEQEVLQFADVVYDLAPEGVRDDREQLKGRLRFKIGQEHGLYDATMAFEQLIGKFFDAIGDERDCGASDAQRIMNYIDRNTRSDLSLADAAKFANMSPSYFSKYFKREVGKNYITYLTDRKMTLAKCMLVQSGLSVVQISGELSYSRPSYFSKTFKKATGLSPTEYRNKHVVDAASLDNLAV